MWLVTALTYRVVRVQSGGEFALVVGTFGATEVLGKTRSLHGGAAGARWSGAAEPSGSQREEFASAASHSAPICPVTAICATADSALSGKRLSSGRIQAILKSGQNLLEECQFRKIGMKWMNLCHIFQVVEGLLKQ